jgi:hypothetical protein
MSSRKIVRITKTEFETDDGTIHPMLFELDEIPTLEDFQKIYDEWISVFQEKELMEEHGE